MSETLTQDTFYASVQAYLELVLDIYLAEESKYHKSLLKFTKGVKVLYDKYFSAKKPIYWGAHLFIWF